MAARACGGRKKQGINAAGAPGGHRGHGGGRERTSTWVKRGEDERDLEQSQQLWDYLTLAVDGGAASRRGAAVSSNVTVDNVNS